MSAERPAVAPGPLPVALAIGGLDPTAGAGITADVRAIAACGARPAAVAACLTVQNRHGFERIAAVDPPLLRAMLEAAAGDGPIAAVKTGLLGGVEAIAVVAAFARSLGAPLVVDPVLGSTAPGLEAGAEVVAAVRDRLCPLATLVTPNHRELELLAGGDPRRLLDLGSGAVLVKDGHGSGAVAVDRLVTADGVVSLRHRRLQRGPVHGTGCALGAAIAAHLARGSSLPAACGAAHDRLVAWLHATPPAADGVAEPLRIEP